MDPEGKKYTIVMISSTPVPNHSGKFITHKL